ncbi:uncharacterized protein HMPREF1541_09265 [Cyphellophora europaea CBS 101466]|uniref:Chalcone isomerase domain-containing protein n=1 Tax=Cyphellophora europaea (strain CBS 101466) TaxID=1220924 RepID=W2SBZ5_CYPE1|nr:uncharacterized protein HMPREF1541_09265 [Cyphellophora europaea CBS 101466]ETN45434.1 hypothetical protein HMPREF1541_09265 [Cyphellophora europaea CBS 101466]
MKPSPIRFLVSRHLCVCRSHLPATAARVQPFLRLSLARRNASYSAPASPAYCSGEELKRRHQSKPADDGDPKFERAQTMKRMRYSAFGIAFCAVAMYGAIQAYDLPIATGTSKSSSSSGGSVTHNDGPAPPSPDNVMQQAELVPTGTTSVPFFPRTIELSSPAATSTSQTTPQPSLPAGTVRPNDDPATGSTEYQLLGLGIRTVSFLSIQVYVVGLYIATPDIAKLQERLIRTIDPVATTLVPGEKDQLRSLLLDPTRSEEVWNTLLREAGIRTALRIVPTRNTDFMHMRDGFVRGITARASSPLIAQDSQFDPNGTFGKSLNDFKSVFGGASRKKLPFGHTLLLERDVQGGLRVVCEDSKHDNAREVMGAVADERVARLLWLCYLGGKNVSSEEARRSVVEGCVEWTGRPVGTVATQVV